MVTRVANPTASKPIGRMAAWEAREAAEDMQAHGWQAMAYEHAEGHAVYVRSEGRETVMLSTHEECEQYMIRRQVAWMLRNGPAIMMGDVDG